MAPRSQRSKAAKSLAAATDDEPPPTPPALTTKATRKKPAGTKAVAAPVTPVDTEAESPTSVPSEDEGVLPAPAAAPEAALPDGVKTAKWTAGDDEKMILAFLTAKQGGHQAESGWKATAYAAAVEALKGSELVSGGLPKNKSAVSTHWQKVRCRSSRYSSCRRELELTLNI